MISEQEWKELDLLGYDKMNNAQLGVYVEFLKTRIDDLLCFGDKRITELQQSLDDQVTDYRTLTNDVDKAVVIIRAIEFPIVLEANMGQVLDLLQY